MLFIFFTAVAGLTIPVAKHWSIKPIIDTKRNHFFEKYQPLLHIAEGCAAFPAVSAEGVVSAGLKTSGPPFGDCQNSVGQVYARLGSFSTKVCILYAWYFPKEQPPSKSISVY